MDMIRHDHVRASLRVREMVGDGAPNFSGDLAQGGQSQLAAVYFAKQAFALVRNDGDEICPGLGVIVPWQADGPAVVIGGGRGHACLIVCGAQSALIK